MPRDGLEPDGLDEDAERLLIAGRPRPDDAFMEKLELRLMGHRARRPRRAPLAAALGLTGSLAAIMVVAALAGSGPLASDGEQPARAKQNCTTSTVTRTRPEGELLLKNGKATVVERDRAVTRTVQGCG